MIQTLQVMLPERHTYTAYLYIMYQTGAGNLLWVVVWLLVTSDTPAKHKRIKEIEKNYIMKSIGESPESKVSLFMLLGPSYRCCEETVTYSLQL